MSRRVTPRRETQGMPNADHLRRQLGDLQKQAASELKKDSDASIKAARARESASRSRSTSTVNMKLREAEREDKKALGARKKRAQIDAKIADLTKKLYDEEARASREQVRAFDSLQNEIRRQHNHSHMQIRQNLTQASIAPAGEFDFFISHATPDKESIAIPLQQALEERGARVWIDATQIKIGDSLRQRIDDGLKRSRYGIVILSHSFLAGREWTERELNGLFVREEEAREPRILPIWHDVTKTEVASYSPIVADKAALKSADHTIDEMADILMRSLGPVGA